MLTSRVTGDSWSLRLNGKTWLSSTPGEPFATAVLRKKEYTSNRGTVSVELREIARIRLTAAEHAGRGAMRFSGEGHSLLVTPREVDGGVVLDFLGEPGWAYEFVLPASEDEAVFGGGEQYRKANLRGETVVNFVSEHIKASTIVEKALLPGGLYREKKHSQIGSYAPMPVFVTDRRRLILFDTAADGSSDFSEKTAFRFSSARAASSFAASSSRSRTSSAYSASVRRCSRSSRAISSRILSVMSRPPPASRAAPGTAAGCAPACRSSGRWRFRNS